MFTDDEIIEIKEYLDEMPEDSKVYIGSDSIKYKKGRVDWARYVIVLVVHIGQSSGCKVFHYTERERMFGEGRGALRYRLMNEVYKVTELYIKMADVLERFETEVHLDINSDSNYDSNTVVKEAVGYVKGVTGLDAKIKPESLIASHCSDHLCKYGTLHRNEKSLRYGKTKDE